MSCYNTTVNHPILNSIWLKYNTLEKSPNLKTILHLPFSLWRSRLKITAKKYTNNFKYNVKDVILKRNNFFFYSNCHEHVHDTTWEWWGDNDWANQSQYEPCGETPSVSQQSSVTTSWEGRKAGWMLKQQRHEAHAECSVWALFTSLVGGSDIISNCDFSDEQNNIQDIHRHMYKHKTRRRHKQPQ